MQIYVWDGSGQGSACCIAEALGNIWYCYFNIMLNSVKSFFCDVRKHPHFCYKFPNKRKLYYTNCVFRAGVHKILGACVVVTKICMP